MRVALLSFELPPVRPVGGIGTYTWNAANMLAAGGHDVEVFSAGPAGLQHVGPNLKIRWVDTSDRFGFRHNVVAPFAQRHDDRGFDVMESPEYGAEGAEVATRFPSIARVVRLHMPHFLVQTLNRTSFTVGQRLRFSLGALRRGRVAWLAHDDAPMKRQEAVERAHTLGADRVAAPCRSVLEIVAARWAMDAARCCTFPNVYIPTEQLLRIGEPTGQKRIVFVGRLEPRKGIFDLVAAIPPVLARHPDTRVVFVGPSVPLAGHLSSETVIRHRLRHHADSLEFIGLADGRKVAEQLAAASIAVFPSRWENFPNVCLEAMSAGRAVVGSTAGGMAEMIEDGISGLLVPPEDPTAIAAALIRLLDRPDQQRLLGCKARQRVLTTYSAAAVLPQQLACYHAALASARERCLA